MATKTYKLAVFEQGKGKPLVLLHGSVSSHRYWNQVVELLPTNKWQIISPDLLGFGDSPKPRNAVYDLEQYVACVDEAITSIQKPPYIVVGHSMGAMIAIKWATDKPELFTKLILTSMPLFKRETMWQQLASIAGEDSFFTRKHAAKAAVRAYGWASLLPIKVMPFQDKWPKHITEDSRKHKPRSYKRTIKNIVFADELLDMLKDVKVPVHMIIGKHDGMIGEQGIKRLKEIAKTNKKVTVQVVDGGHNFPIQNPEIVAKAI